MVAAIHDYEGELHEVRSMARFQMRFMFEHRGFYTDDKFLEAWFRLGGQGRVGTTAEFRKRFCEANHYQIQLPSTKWLPVVEVWGFAIPYYMEKGKPRLMGILPKSWLLKQVGRSVRRPAFCR